MSLKFPKELAVAVKNAKPSCKGVFWRATENIFADSTGRVKASREMRILKKISCKGCSDCAWLIEYLQDDIMDNPEVNFLDDTKSGKMYMLKVDSSQDWESGNWEIDGLGWVEVNED